MSLAVLPACGEIDLTEAEYLERAKEYQDKGDLNASVIEFKNALRKNPDNQEARWLLGNIYIELGDGPSAEKELRRIQKLGTVKEAVVIPLAKSLLLQGKHSTVLSEIHPLGSLSKIERAELHALRGNAYIGERKIEEAAEAYRAALDLDPKQATALIGQARLNAAQRNIKDARISIDKALGSDPEFADGWSLLGDIELTVGKMNEAEAAFTNAIKFRKYTNLDSAKRALARIQLEKFSEAEADLKKLKQQGFEKHPYINYIVGINYFRQQKYAEAADAFAASYADMPDFLPLEIYLATTRYLLGDTEQALDLAHRIYNKAPQSLTAKRLLGAIELSRSEFAAATDVLQKALQDSPDDATILRMLATINLAEGDTKQGVEYYQKIVSIEPDSQQAKKMLMMAKFLDGQSLDEYNSKQASPEHEYTREFLLATAAFRDRNLGQALDRARKLHEQYPEKVDPLKLMAACYLAAGQWDKAEIELEKVLKLEPNEPSAARNLAKVEIQKGNLERAQTLLKALVEAHPGDENAILLLAQTETGLGNQEDGIRILEQALEKNSNLLSVRENLASAYLNAGQVAKVLEVTRDMTDKQLQEKPRLLEIRGKAQMLGGNPVSAERSLQRWTELAPDSAQAHFLYSDSLSRNGKADPAREHLERAVQIDPNYLLARVGQIKMLVQHNELEKAKTALADLKKDFGDRSEVLSIEGWFALGTGEYGTAVDRLSAAVDKSPDTETTILLVRALWAQNKHDEAITKMQGWLKEHPQDLVMLYQLADSYLSLNKEEQAVEIYTKIVELYPNHVAALNNLAWLIRDDDLDQAIVYAERAIEVSPNAPKVLDTLGMLLLKKGDITSGYRQIKKAADYSPEDHEIQLHLSQALIERKKITEAEEVLNSIIEKAPDSKISAEAKALLESLSKE